MKESRVLFDSSAILALVMHLKRRAPLALSEGSTLSLAFYEVGNAIWKECHLHRRLGTHEAEGLVRTMFAIIDAMDVTTIGSEDQASSVLSLADRLGLTYYDASYLAEARGSGKILISDDSTLLEAAKKAGVEAMNTQAFASRAGHRRTGRPPQASLR